MMEVVRGYLLRLTAGAFLSAGLLALIPKGTSKKAAAVLCGLVMLLLALTPLAQLDYDALSEAISRLELEKEEARTGIEIRNQELVARIISGRVQAYILDKAASLGLTVTVELEMETRAATPYPKAVTIHGEATPALALTPLAQLDYDALSEAISRLELEKEEARTGIEIRNQELVARIISGRVQAYILDKAASLGLTVTVELEMETRAATPYPKAVTIHGEATPAQKQQLQQYLEQTFAIPVQRQVWTP